MNPRSTHCEANALTITPSRWLLGNYSTTALEVHRVLTARRVTKVGEHKKSDLT